MYYSFQSSPVGAADELPADGNNCFFILILIAMKATNFNESHQFQWKPLNSMEATNFNENHQFQWKPLILMKATNFNESY